MDDTTPPPPDGSDAAGRDGPDPEASASEDAPGRAGEDLRSEGHGAPARGRVSEVEDEVDEPVEGDRPDVDSPNQTHGVVGAGADTVDGGGSADDYDAFWSSARSSVSIWEVGAIVVGLLALIAIGAALVLSGGDDDDGGEAADPVTDTSVVEVTTTTASTTSTTTTTTTTLPLPPPAAAEIRGPDQMAPTPDTSFPLLAADDFDRPDDPDGLTPPLDAPDATVGPIGPAADEGQEWNALSGLWALESEEAVLTQPDAAGRPSINQFGAVEFTVGTVTVDVSTVTPGAGLVFGYQDPLNYAALYADPVRERWVVAGVLGGVVNELVSIERESGTTGEFPTVQRNADGWIDIYFDGQPALGVRDPQIPTSGGVGLLSMAPPTVTEDPDADEPRFGGIFVAGS